MLHRVMFSALLLASAGLASAAPGDGAPLHDPLTTTAREALRQDLRAVTLVVRRRSGLAAGMWAPGEGLIEGHGWWAGAGRVVTASVLVEGWPVAKADVIEVETPDGERHVAAVGLTESGLGLAVLDVPGLAPPPRLTAFATDDAEVASGRPLYGADRSGLLNRLVIGRAGEGQHAYYWRLEGFMAPGTPLFNGQGRLVSFVGRVAGAEALVLPAKALRALLERADWQ